MSPSQAAVLRGLGLSLLCVLFLIARTYFTRGWEHVNQEWVERAFDFLGFAVIFTVSSLMR
jgi:hypothetical protein